jgi:hypothetical protein
VGGDLGLNSRFDCSIAAVLFRFRKENDVQPPTSQLETRWSGRITRELVSVGSDRLERGEQRCGHLRPKCVIRATRNEKIQMRGTNIEQYLRVHCVRWSFQAGILHHACALTCGNGRRALNLDLARCQTPDANTEDRQLYIRAVGLDCSVFESHWIVYSSLDLGSDSMTSALEY